MRRCRNKNHEKPSQKPLSFNGTVVCNATNPSSLRTDTSSSTGKPGQYPGISVQGNSNTQSASGTRDQAVCKLDDATGQSLHAITQDGDNAIRQLNAVIDAYNLVQAVGCSVTPATKDERASLLAGTAILPTDVTSPELSTLSVDVLKDGVLAIKNVTPTK